MSEQPPTKDKKSPPNPPATKCADCGKRFSPDDTRWDVHLEGTTYKTICTACFEKNDPGWSNKDENVKIKASKKHRK